MSNLGNGGFGFLRPPTSRETDARDQRDRETWRQSSAARGLPPPRSAGDAIGDFVLGPMLGRGSSGYVYRALDRVAGRACALKLIGIEEPKTLVRLKLGFRRMMTLHHPNLVRVDRIHHIDDLVALSMEEVEGETFRDLASRFSRMNSEAAFAKLTELTRDYASALSLMHAKGLVHRDIKPANLMVDEQGRGVIIDYGLVGTFDPESDPNGIRDYFVGTPMYVAPEVLWSQHHGPASDIFSLGMVLLEAIQLITGHRAVARSETSRTEDREVLGTLLRGISDSVPEVLRDVCVEMLEFDPADRPTAMRVARLGLPPQVMLPPLGQPELYGRSDELAEIHAWVDSVFAGGGGRLHLTGRTGIGKSRLLEELLEAIESKRWGQVFHARCQRREDQPMQAFGQITDAIVARYTRGDREPMQVDPVSRSILTMAFPALEAVLETDLQLPPIRETETRLDALEAGARLSVELRKVGPLFFVIDDVQWADRDSLNMLDRLQTLSGGMLGLVTVSRDGIDQQRVPPDVTISLRPLELSDGVAMLTQAARRWAADVQTELLHQLAASTEGCPFRLGELANEFRPGGVLADLAAESSVTRVDHVWQRRMAKLSEHAVQTLRFIVTAGRPVSIEQLGELSKQPEAVEAAVSELVQQRVVTDEATGGECISVMHDSVADRLVATLIETDRREAHRQWASLLMRADRPEEMAARIAKQLIDAGEPGRAVSYAILAAEDAERRLATTEAGFWHKRVIPYASGAEKLDRIRRAARCFYDANRPDEAARLYHRLAGLVDDPERFECELRAVTLLIRSGNWDEVRIRLAELAKRVGTPRPKSAGLAKWSLLLRTLRSRSLAAGLRRIAFTSDRQSPRPPRGAAKLARRRLQLCLALERPLVMLDNVLAAEMNLAGMSEAVPFGDFKEKLYVATGSALFGCHDRGWGRIRSERLLQALETPIEKLGDPKLIADHAAGLAFAHACSCRWSEVLDPMRRGVKIYQTISDPHGFETAHTRWPGLWACFHLGRIAEMSATVDGMLDDAMHRRDRFCESVATLGIAGAAWLARDNADDLVRARESLTRSAHSGRFELMDHFAWLSEMQSLLYVGDWKAALELQRQVDRRLNRVLGTKIQFIRVHRAVFGMLLAIRHVGFAGDKFAGDKFAGDRGWAKQSWRQLRQLRRERLLFTQIVAEFGEGLLLRRLGRDAEAERRLMQARDRAALLQLRPWESAAQDALTGLASGRDGGLLPNRLAEQGVVCPEQFARLYTVREEH